uniref:F-box domain-containing protein n=1 Tax=viral metagenome TaxID=1070528 RepID=A0A6C0JU01_9ZZZZ
MDSLSAYQLGHLFSYFKINDYINLKLVCQRFYQIILRSSNNPKIKCDTIIFSHESLTLKGLDISTYDRISEDNCSRCARIYIMGRNDSTLLMNSCKFCINKRKKRIIRYCALCESKSHDVFYFKQKICNLCNKEAILNLHNVCAVCDSKMDMAFSYSHVKWAFLRNSFMKYIQISFFKHGTDSKIYICNDKKYLKGIKTVKYLKIKGTVSMTARRKKNTYLTIAPTYLQIELTKIDLDQYKNIVDHLILDHCEKIHIIYKDFKLIEEITNNRIKRYPNIKVFYESKNRFKNYFPTDPLITSDNEFFVHYLKGSVDFGQSNKGLTLYHEVIPLYHMAWNIVHQFIERNKDKINRILTTKTEYMEYIFSNLIET